MELLEAKSGVPQERDLLARHKAALRLLHQGREADGLLLLSYVVWSSTDLDAWRLREPETWNHGPEPTVHGTNEP